MPYSAEINRAQPTSFVFLVDQSGSMGDPIGGTGRRKSEAVADAINRLLHALVRRSTKGDGVRDYFHIGVIGYGAKVGPALGGKLTPEQLVPISAVADNVLRVEERTKKVDDGMGGVASMTAKMQVWFEPVADGSTPMCAALEQARQRVAAFAARYPHAHPPIVLNITDGEADDPEAAVEAAAGAVRAVATTDGNVLLFNLHVSCSNWNPVSYPDSDAALPDKYARLLYRTSSVLTPRAVTLAGAKGYRVSAASRGFVFNGDAVTVSEFLDIGTQVPPPR
ncbi:MAG: VWA domain-containing protein [Planctomycetes bacterium]|nr:VWA domain-containing protein [Planctomycetota bacterium]